MGLAGHVVVDDGFNCFSVEFLVVRDFLRFLVYLFSGFVCDGCGSVDVAALFFLC